MLRKPKRAALKNDQDIIRVVRGVIDDHVPRLLERDGEAVAVLLSPEDYAAFSHELEPDPWAGYDAARARAALARSGGALADVDRDQLLRDIHGAREQASGGRPA